MSLYYSLGGPCIPKTNAYTSNYKFLPLVDPIYYKNYTYMYKYPGSEQNFVTVKSDVLDGHPIQIKNFFGKIGVESTQYQNPFQPKLETETNLQTQSQTQSQTQPISTRTNFHKNVNPSRYPGCC